MTGEKRLESNLHGLYIIFHYLPSVIPDVLALCHYALSHDFVKDSL